MSTKKKDDTGPVGAEVGSWRGYVRYQCTACGYDTLDLGKFEDHYRIAHGQLEFHADPPPAFEVAPEPTGEMLVED